MNEVEFPGGLAGTPIARAWPASRARHGAPRALEGVAHPHPFVSVVVPVTERIDPLGELYEEYAGALRAAGYSHEFLFIAGPDFQEAVRPLLDLVAGGKPVRIYTVGHSMDDGPLLNAAVQHVRGTVVVTLPSYRRVTADALPRLIRSLSDGADIAVARRTHRNDPWINRAQTRLFGALLDRVTGGGFQDVGCGVRAMPREVLGRLSLHGASHRFLPILAAQDGYAVREVDAAQHPDEARTRVYRPGVYVKRLIDLLGLFFLLRFREKPLRFFGLLGGAAGLAGLVVLLVVAVQRLQGSPVGDRPMLLVGLLGVVLGVQFVALGLVGEILVYHHAPEWRPYRRREPAPGERH